MALHDFRLDHVFAYQLNLSSTEFHISEPKDADGQKLHSVYEPKDVHVLQQKFSVQKQKTLR